MSQFRVLSCWRFLWSVMLAFWVSGGLPRANGQGSEHRFGSGTGVVLCSNIKEGEPLPEWERPTAKLEFADIFEGRQRYRWTYLWTTESTAERAASRARLRLYEAMPRQMRKAYRFAKKLVLRGKWKASLDRVELLEDSTHEMCQNIILDSRCRLEHLPYQRIGDDIVASISSVRDLQSPPHLIEQAIDHETVYFLARTRAGDRTSERTRAIIAYVYSDQYDSQVMKGLLSDLWSKRPLTLSSSVMGPEAP